MLSLICLHSACVCAEEGRLFMWGDNSVGQIGLGDEVCAAEPRELNVGQAVISVSCGNRHSAFVTGASLLDQTQTHSDPVRPDSFIFIYQ